MPKYFFNVSVVGIFELFIDQVFRLNMGLSVCSAYVLFVLVEQMVPFAHGPLNVLCDPGQ